MCPRLRASCRSRGMPTARRRRRSGTRRARIRAVTDPAGPIRSHARKHTRARTIEGVARHEGTRPPPAVGCTRRWRAQPHPLTTAQTAATRRADRASVLMVVVGDSSLGDQIDRSISRRPAPVPAGRAPGGCCRRAGVRADAAGVLTAYEPACQDQVPEGEGYVDATRRNFARASRWRGDDHSHPRGPGNGGRDRASRRRRPVAVEQDARAPGHGLDPQAGGTLPRRRRAPASRRRGAGRPTSSVATR